MTGNRMSSDEHRSRGRSTSTTSSLIGAGGSGLRAAIAGYVQGRIVCKSLLGRGP